MSTSSTDSAETLRLDGTGKYASAIIRDRVVDIANQSRDRSEFFKNLGTDLRAQFGVAIVAIQASHWNRPIMLVTDQQLSTQIERDAIKDLLSTASVTPIACDVPLMDSSDQDSTRAIRVELLDSPERASVLLIYGSGQSHSSVSQIADLRLLADYAQSSRSVVPQLPIDREEVSTSSETGLTRPDTSEVFQNRNSLRLFHLDLDLDATSYRIANESRRLLGCDRITLLTKKSSRYRVQAVSGVSVVDRRSNSIGAIERLASRALVMSRPLVLPGVETLPPQIQTPLDDYLDESGVMTAVLLPLFAPDTNQSTEDLDDADDPSSDGGKIVGVMVLEYFSGNVPSAVSPAMQSVASEASLSLRNALEHKQVFGLSLWKSVGGLVQSSRMPWVIAATLLLVASLTFSMFYQVEHHVMATGTVEPTVRREVFASVDGIVKRIHVSDGQAVKRGDTLLELENAELQNKAESLAAEIQTATKRLASIQAVRLSNSVDATQATRMALEERQLKSELANLRSQQAVIETQQEELLIKSPIDGAVLGWQMERRLSNRPVARGNLLISVADHDGPWSLRLQIPDHDAGPVLASVQSDARLPIQFAVATQPEASFTAALESVGTAARMDQAGRYLLDATADVAIGKGAGDASSMDEFEPSGMRVGSNVTAKIACGQRSLLRSWFSDVFDFVHRHVLFHF